MPWVAALLTTVIPARAQEVQFDIDDAAARQLGIDAQQVEDALGGTIGDQLRLVDQEDFLAAMANATAISTRGMGVDYATNIETFVLGFSVGSGVATSGKVFGREGEENPLPTGGFSSQISIMAGVALGAFDGSGEDEDATLLDRVRVYANGMSLRMPSGAPFEGSMTNLGAHLQLSLVNPMDAEVVEWGGFALTGGYEHAIYHLSLQQELPIETTTGDARLRWAATGEYGVDAWSATLPLELSTNLRIVFVTAYAGAGLDLGVSRAKSLASLSGPLRGEAGQQSRDLGDASVSLEQAKGGDPARPRLFFGAQLDVFVLKAYGQLNLGTGDTYGGHIGLRVAL
jgi:hypothetical protein